MGRILGLVGLSIALVAVMLLSLRQMRPQAATPATGAAVTRSAPEVSSAPVQAQQQVRDALAAAEAEAQRQRDAADKPN